MNNAQYHSMATFTQQINSVVIQLSVGSASMRKSWRMMTGRKFCLSVKAAPSHGVMVSCNSTVEPGSGASPSTITTALCQFARRSPFAWSPAATLQAHDNGNPWVRGGESNFEGYEICSGSLKDSVKKSL